MAGEGRWYPGLPRVAVLGAGQVGSVIARPAVDAGYDASIASSGDPEDIELISRVLAPGAERRWAIDAVEDADIVVLAIPLHRFAALPPQLLADRLVVDTMNYWPPVDAVQEIFEDGDFTSSEIVQRRLPRSTVVKTLNHIGYHELGQDRRSLGSPDRRALGVAGDDPGAVEIVSDVVKRIGYETVRLGSLSAGRLLQPGGPVFGVPLHRYDFEAVVGAEAA